MKTRITLVVLVGFALFVVTLPISSAARPASLMGAYGVQDQDTKDAKIKTGPEVAQRVNQRKQSNTDVRNALRAFEKNESKNGRRPKIEESRSLTSRVSLSRQARIGTCKGCPPLKKVGFHPQGLASDDVIEIIFVPTYVTLSEWQGTAIFTLYDSAMNFLDQYIADVVVRPDPTLTFLSVVYEVSFEGGQAWLQSDPAEGMIMDLNFQWGTPLDQQPDPSIMPGVISATSGSRLLRNVSYSMEPQLVMPVGLPRVPGPRTRGFLKCSGILGGAAVLGAAAGCGFASLPLFGAPFVPCFAGTSVGGATAAVAGCAGVAIFGG